MFETSVNKDLAYGGEVSLDSAISISARSIVTLQTPLFIDEITTLNTEPKIDFLNSLAPEYKVFNSKGLLIHHNKNDPLTNLDFLKPGFYFIEYTLDQKHFRTKLLVK